MAKVFIEKVPFVFIQGMYDIFSDKYLTYYADYKEVDDKGRYLYWEDFKWRVKEGDDPLVAWYAVKLARTNGSKQLSLQNKNNHFFHYSVPGVLQSSLYQIMEFSRVGLVPSDSIGNAYLLSSLTIEEAINSSQLEGASTTRRVAKEMLKTHRKPQTEDEQMIYNNYLLMKELQVEKDDDLSIAMMLRFHKIATQDTTHNDVVPGEFRVDDKIYIADRDNNVLYQPPSHDEIIGRLNSLVVFVNTKHEGVDFIHPVIKAIILHFMIGYIHPFSDGNGRTARALFYWFMLKNGYDYFEYISISKLLKDAPAKYSKAYQYVDADNNDLNYFIYKGLYFVLLGAISPAEGRGPDDIKVERIIEKVRTQGIQEVVIATDPDTEGEMTALHISQQLRPTGVKISRIGLGIPMGSSVEYADLSTLTMSMHSRREMLPETSNS